MRSSALVLLLTFSWLGCENSVAPFKEAPDTFFAIYGHLDMRADTQFVRVNPIRTTLEAPPVSGEGISVILRDLATGQTETWADSVGQDDAGNAVLWYYATQALQPGRRYRLEVSDEAGNTTTAITEIPPVPPNITLNISESDTISTTLSLNLFIQTAPVEIKLHYTVDPFQLGTMHEETISYGPSGNFSNGPWLFEAVLERDRRIILTRLEREQDDRTMILVELSIMYTLRSREWENPFPPTNISKGHGFFASYGFYEAVVPVDTATVRRSGFVLQP